MCLDGEMGCGKGIGQREDSRLGNLSVFLSFFFLLLFLPMLQCSMYETKKLSVDSTPAQFSCSVMPFRV